MKCNKCEYEWETKSERMFVTCPNCLLKTSKKIKEDNLKEREKLRKNMENGRK